MVKFGQAERLPQSDDAVIDISVNDTQADVLRKLDLPRHPHLLIERIFGEKLWPRQREILDSVFDYRLTAVQSGQAVGKTFIAARVALAFLLAFSPLYGYKGGTKVIIVGPKFEQLRKQIWAELSGAYYRSRFPIGGNLQAHDLVLAPNWYAGIFAADKERPEKVQGYHAENFLAIIEEATGVPDEIYEAIQSCGTSENSRILALCNPIRLSGWMYRVCTDVENAVLKERKQRNVIKISALDNPNYLTGENLYPGLASRSFVDERRNDWGEHSPMWQSRICGEFPTVADNALIPWQDIEDACTAKRGNQIMGGDKSLGLDIARQGENKSVIVSMDGGRVTHILAERIPNVMKAALWFATAYHDFGGTPAIDENGLGGGPYDKLKYELKVPVRGFIAQRRSSEKGKERFANLKAEIGWRMRELFRDGLIYIPRLPNRDALKSDLGGYTYEEDNRGRIKVVDPAHSPDFGDAMLIALWAQHSGGITGQPIAGVKRALEREF